MAGTAPQTSPPSLTTIPTEVRRELFKHCFAGAKYCRYGLDSDDEIIRYPVSDHYAILLTCKLFFAEGINLYYDGIVLKIDDLALEQMSPAQMGAEKFKSIRLVYNIFDP